MYSIKYARTSILILSVFNKIVPSLCCPLGLTGLSFNTLAPIYLSQEQYLALKYSGIWLTITHIPEDATGLRIFTVHNDIGNATIKDEYTNHISSTHYIQFSKLEKGKKMYACIYTNNRGCVPKLILMVQTAETETNSNVNDWEKKYAVESIWVQVCIMNRCTITLNWGNNKGDVFDKNARPKQDELQLGYNVTFVCDGSSEAKMAKWHHKYHDGKPIIELPNEPSKYKLSLKTEAFDNNTIISCTDPTVKSGSSYILKDIQIARDDFNCLTKSTVSSRVFQSLTVLGCYKNGLKDSAPLTALKEYKKSFYNSKMKPSHSCNLKEPLKFGNTTHKVIYNATALIFENKIEVINDLENMNEKRNGSIICCLYYVLNKDTLTIERHVTKKRMLKYSYSAEYQPPKKVQTEEHISATTEFNTAAGSQKGGNDLSYYFVCGAIVGIIIMTIILSIVYKKRYNNKSIVTPNVKEEDTMHSNQVQYAELELSPASQNIKAPVYEESPYAEINNKQVLYAELELSSPPRNNSRPVVEESPYAEIMKEVTYSEIQMTSQPRGVNRPVFEETPYAQIVKKCDR